MCLAIVATRKSIPNQRVFGKKKLVECGKEMTKITPLTYACPDGHTRHWPISNWEDRAENLRRVEVHQKSES